MYYKEYKEIDYYDISLEIFDFWKKNNIFQKAIDFRSQDNKKFIFYEGPPSANGEPGIHHVMSRAVKEIFCRLGLLTIVKNVAI